MMPESEQVCATAITDQSRSRVWYRRFPVACFLVALVLTILSDAFYEQIPGGKFLEAAILTVMLLSSLPALGCQRRTFILAVVLITPAVAGRWLNLGWPDEVPSEVFLMPGLLFLAFIVFHLLRFIFRAPRVDSEVLCAAMAGYLMLGLMCSFAFILVARLVPDAFVFHTGPAAEHAMKGFTAIYFSFVSLCTVGYGEIVPVASAARMLVILEAMCGTFYVTVLIARLVAMQVAYSSTNQTPNRTT